MVHHTDVRRAHHQPRYPINREHLLMIVMVAVAALAIVILTVQIAFD